MHIVALVISIFAGILSFFQGGLLSIVGGIGGGLGETFGDTVFAEEAYVAGGSGLLVVLGAIAGIVGGILAGMKKTYAWKVLIGSIVVCILAGLSGFSDAFIYAGMYGIAAFCSYKGDHPEFLQEGSKTRQPEANNSFTSPPEKVNPHSGKKVNETGRSGYYYCLQCQKEMEGKLSFCPYCGQKVVFITQVSDHEESVEPEECGHFGDKNSQIVDEKNIAANKSKDGTFVNINIPEQEIPEEECKDDAQPLNACPFCNTKIKRPDQVVCMNCGRKLPDFTKDNETGDQPSTQISTEKPEIKICSHCGHEALPTQKACFKCGGKLVNTVEQTYEANGNTSQKIGTVLGIAIVCVFIAIFFLSDNGGQQQVYSGDTEYYTNSSNCILRNDHSLSGKKIVLLDKGVSLQILDSWKNPSSTLRLVYSVSFNTDNGEVFLQKGTPLKVIAPVPGRSFKVAFSSGGHDYSAVIDMDYLDFFWSKVKTQSGQSGWLHSSLVEGGEGS